MANNDFKQALPNLVECYDILKKQSNIDYPEISRLMVDIVDIANQLGQISYAIEFADSTLKFQLNFFIRNEDLCNFSDPLEDRKREFTYLLDDFYECSGILTDICLRSFSNIKFIKNFSSNLYLVLLQDINSYIANFVKG